MARFIGVTTDTITTWTSDRNKPLGGPLVKLRFYLEAVGYNVAELRGMHGQAGYLLAEMLAYGLVTVEQAAEQLGYENPNSVYRVAHGGSHATPDRAVKIKDMHGSHKQALDTARQQLAAELGSTRDAPVVSFTRPDPTPSAEDDGSIAALAHLVLAITPLLEKAVAGTKDKRNLLRKLTGPDGMFRLSKASSRLCSEKALEVVNNQ